jgi:uncharacterized protein with von Willebrand factor type A (vWA) domain
MIPIEGHMASDQIFIFFLDRSGSMAGRKMKMANNALKLFIQSLPKGAMFEIIGFGSHFKPSSKGKGFENNDENVRKILNEIDMEYEANLGGTDILRPMKYAMGKNYSSIEIKDGVEVAK